MNRLDLPLALVVAATFIAVGPSGALFAQAVSDRPVAPAASAERAAVAPQPSAPQDSAPNAVSASSPLSAAEADIAIRRARRFCEFGQYREAEAALGNLSREVRAGLLQPHMVGALHLMARIDFESGRYQEAVELAHRYEQFLAQLKNTTVETVAQRQATLVLEAESQLALGHVSEAEKLFEQAIALPGGLREADPLWQARVALVRAEAADTRHDHATALQFYKQIESLCRQTLARPVGGVLRPPHRTEAAQLAKTALLKMGEAPAALALLGAELKHLAPRDPSHVALLTDIADCQRRLHDEAKARQALVSALGFVGHDARGAESAEFADLLSQLGASHARSHDSARAANCWRESAAIYEKLCAAPAGDQRARALRAEYRQRLERIYQRLRDWTAGARVAAQLLDEREKTLVPDDPAIWRSKTALGEFYAHAHDDAKARPLLTAALRYWESRRPESSLEVSGVLNSLAAIALRAGDTTEAMARFEQAAPLCRGVFGQASIENIEMQSQLAAMLAAQGQTQLASDHYRKALEACRAAVKEGEPRAEELLVGLQLSLIGLYRGERQYAQAAELCEQSLEAYRHDHPGHDQVLLLFYLTAGSLRLAEHESRSGETLEGSNFVAAEKLAAAADELCKRAGQSEKITGANVDMLAGVLAFERGDIPAAEERFRHAASIVARSPDEPLLMKCEIWLAEAQLRRAGALKGDSRRAALDAALAQARRATKEHHAVGFASPWFKGEMIVAQAQRSLGQNAAAVATLSEAVEKIASPRAAAIGTDSDRAEFFAQFRAAFDLLVDWRLADGKPLAALGVAENARNHAYLDHLSLASVDSRVPLAGSEQAQRNAEQRGAVADYHRAVRRLREVSDRPGGEEAIRAGVDEIAALRRKYSQLETNLRDESAYCRSLWGDAQAPLDWRQLTAKLLPAGQVLLYYHFGQSKSYVFLVSRGKTDSAPRVEAIELRTPERLAARVGGKPGPTSRRLAAKIFELAWRELALPAATDKTLRGLDRDEQRLLAEMVLPAAARAAVMGSGAGYAYVSLDPVVRQMPLEGLLVDAAADRYVADLFPPLSYAPSATLLARRAEAHAGDESKALSLLAVGVGRPTSGRDAATDHASESSLMGIATIGAHYLAIGGVLAPLPVAAEECSRIESSFERLAPRCGAERLEGDAATKSRLREVLAGRAFVHVAARGATDDHRGELFGAAALAAEPAAPPNERFLTLGELPALPLGDCKLIALAHWTPHASANRAGDPSDWLALGFMAAGAEDVLMCQWPGDDEAAALFAESFWSHVAGDFEQHRPPKYAAALAAARADVRRDSRFHAPRYWASWMLVGPTR